MKSKEFWIDRRMRKDVHGLYDLLYETKKGSYSADAPENTFYWQWEYSTKAIELISEYKQQFPTIFQCLERCPEDMEYSVERLFPQEQQQQSLLEQQEQLLLQQLQGLQTSVTAPAMHQQNSPAEMLESARKLEAEIENNRRRPESKKEKLNAVKEFLDRAVEKSAHLVPVESQVMETAASQGVKEFTGRLNASRKTHFRKVTVSRNSGVHLSSIKCQLWFDSPTAVTTVPRLGDRVANMGYHSIPFGMKGVIIAIHPKTKCVLVLFDNLVTKIVKYAQVVNISQPRYISPEDRNEQSRGANTANSLSYKKVTSPERNVRTERTVRKERKEAGSTGKAADLLHMLQKGDKNHSPKKPVREQGKKGKTWNTQVGRGKKATGTVKQNQAQSSVEELKSLLQVSSPTQGKKQQAEQKQKQMKILQRPKKSSTRMSADELFMNLKKVSAQETKKGSQHQPSTTNSFNEKVLGKLGLQLPK